MPCVYLSDVERDWEPLEEAAPVARLSTHPSGHEVVLQATVWDGTSVERAGVWDVATRRLSWAPAGVNAMAWTPRGDRLLALAEARSSAPRGRGITVTPMQSEIDHRCDLYEWPSRRLLASTELDYPTGWLVDVVPAPSRSIAAFVWIDQTEAGVEFLSWQDDRIVQIRGLGYYGEDSNLITGPVFSPDGRSLVVAYGAGVWWAEERDEPSPGGLRKAGWIVIIDPTTGMTEERDVNCHVPPGWSPADPESIHNEMLSVPGFISNREFVVTTATGQTVHFTIDA